MFCKYFKSLTLTKYHYALLLVKNGIFVLFNVVVVKFILWLVVAYEWNVFFYRNKF